MKKFAVYTRGSNRFASRSTICIGTYEKISMPSVRLLGQSYLALLQCLHVPLLLPRKHLIANDFRQDYYGQWIP